MPSQALLSRISQILDIVAVEKPCLNVVPLLDWAGWSTGECYPTAAFTAGEGLPLEFLDFLSASFHVAKLMESGINFLLLGPAEQIAAIPDLTTVFSYPDSAVQTAKLVEQLQELRPGQLPSVRLRHLQRAQAEHTESGGFYRTFVASGHCRAQLSRLLA